MVALTAAHTRPNMARRTNRLCVWTIAALILLPSLSNATLAANNIIAPTGTLRAAYIVTNLAQARRDPATGEITGVIADITRELGRREGLPVTITPVPTAAAVLDAVRSGGADIGFVAPNPERTGLALYSNTYMLVHQSALVLADSVLQSVNDLDRAGQVIGINTDDTVGVWLKQSLKSASVRATPDYSLREAVQWLKDGSVVAFAGNRQRLASGTQGVAGLRLLPDNLYSVGQAVAVPTDQPGRLAAINAFLNELRASGFLAQSVARSGVDGISVAP